MSVPAPSAPARPPPSIRSLPAELTELILIFAALGGFPHAIAAFAQTCRAFRTLVYDSADQHLWREIFLTTFDDPRAVTPDAAADEDEDDKSFGWGPEFCWRVWTANYLCRDTTVSRRDTTASRPPSPPTRTGRPPTKADRSPAACDARALETLLSVVHTAQPCPPTLVFSSAPAPARNPSFNADFSVSLATEPAYPIFPPRSITSGGSSAQRGVCSLNIPWVEAVLRRGLPRRLTMDLSSLSWKGGSMGQTLGEREARTMQALGRIVCYTGFTPVPEVKKAAVTKGVVSERTPEPEPAEDDAGSSISARTLISAEDAGEASGTAQDDEDAPSPTPTPPPTLSMSATAQQKRARRLARMRVYNMRYLAPHRHWGPFFSTATPARRRPGAEEHDELLGPILALFAEAAADESESESEHEEDDEQAMPALADDESDEEDSSANDANGNGYIPPHMPPPPVHVPTAAELRPDWSYLAAVRMVVEANLRESVGADELSGLCALDGLRRGSAPKDVGAPKEMGTLWKGEKARDSEAESDQGDAEKKTDEWDWAGVAGVWRRCICWMDYRDLILHNLSEEFHDQLSEAVRILPMRLRVVSHSPCLIPGYKDRPTLHVEGETSGSAPSGHVRRVHGTVCVVADGSVRWSLCSSIDGGDADEWVTEGVQLGGLNSAMGVVGLWTGAHHERMDPLGPFWAWKVG